MYHINKSKFFAGFNGYNFLIIFLLILNAQCKSPQKYFYLPNGEIYTQSAIKSYEKFFEVKYEQYTGFVGHYNDSMLSIVNLKIVGEETFHRDILSKEKIDRLKNKIAGKMQFIYLIDTTVKNFDFENYISMKYRGLKKEKVSEKNIKFFSDDNLICEIQYYNIVKPNFLLTIYPIRMENSKKNHIKVFGK